MCAAARVSDHDLLVRPDFHFAMPPAEAEAMFNELMVQYRTEYTDDKVQAGIFGALLLVDVHVEA